MSNRERRPLRSSTAQVAGTDSDGDDDGRKGTNVDVRSQGHDRA